MLFFFNILADVLFPKRCVGCERYGAWWCQSCYKSVTLHTVQDASTPPSDSVLKTVWVAASYDQESLQRALHAFKYQFVTALAKPLGGLMVDFCKSTASAGMQADMIVAVPLFYKRERWRGFNQAQLLAQAVGHHRNLSVVPALKRQVSTRPQVGLDAPARRLNVQGAFICPNPAVVAGRRVLLVDDVISTGSTLAACAEALYQAGAVRVEAFVLTKN